jgi:hypothetical protein
MLRTAIFNNALPRTSVALSRSLHSTPVACKTVTEKVSDVADTVSYARYQVVDLILTGGFEGEQEAWEGPGKRD